MHLYNAFWNTHWKTKSKSKGDRHEYKLAMEGLRQWKKIKKCGTGKWHGSKRERERESYTLMKMAIIVRKKQINILKQIPKVAVF